MELDDLTEEFFREELNTKFYVPLEERRVELELVGVEGDKSSMEKIEGVERFVLYFQGPGDFYLPQRTYPMEHDRFGRLEIFIVPVGKGREGFRYEAIFSRMTGEG